MTEATVPTVEERAGRMTVTTTASDKLAAAGTAHPRYGTCGMAIAVIERLRP
jgi:hypothetical protein